MIENNLFLNKKSEKKLKSKKGIIHFETQNIFKNHKKIKNGTKISKNLKSLRINRNKADYDKHTDEPLNEIILESKTKSKIILELLEEEFN